MSVLTAIELGATSLTAVTVRSAAGGMEIVQSGRADIDDTGLPGALRKCGVAAPKVVLVIPRGQAVVRDFEFPESTPDELVAMVRFQVEREMPLPADQIRYSYVETARGAGKVRVHVAAVPCDVLDAALAAVEEAGIKVSNVFISSHGLLSLYQGREPVALVEVAGGEAEIAVVNRGQIEYSHTASLSEGVSAEGLAAEIDRTLLAYAAKVPGNGVVRVVLAGEGEEASKLATSLRELLRREVATVGPGDLETASLAGLCAGVLRGLSLPDILKPPVAVKKFRLTRTHRWVGAAALAGILVIGGMQWALSRKRGELEKKRQELRQLEPRAAEVVRMNQQTAVAQQWYRDRISWLTALDALRGSVNRSNLWIVSVTFEDTGDVRLQGRTKDDKYVADLDAALKKSSRFKGSSIEKVSDNNDKGDYKKDFTVNARLVGIESKKK